MWRTVWQTLSNASLLGLGSYTHIQPPSKISCYKLDPTIRSILTVSFSHQWNSLLITCYPATYNLLKFKSNVNRHLSSVFMNPHFFTLKYSHHILITVKAQKTKQKKHCITWCHEFNSPVKPWKFYAFICGKSKSSTTKTN